MSARNRRLLAHAHRGLGPGVTTNDPRPTVAELFLARNTDDHAGLRFVGDAGPQDDREWTWREVVSESAARAAVLRSLRRPGPFHVGVLLDNVPDHVFLLGAAALAGATIVGVNPTRRGPELAQDIRHTDCQLIVTEERQRGLLEGLDLGLGDDRILSIDGQRWLSLVDERAGAVTPDAIPRASALYLLLFTSGSTGTPKAVRATQGRIASTSQMGFRRDDVLYCSMPLFHGNALVSNLFPGLGSGATVVLRRRFSASAFLTDIRRCGVTYFNTVGRALAYILATPPSPADRDHRVRFALAPESSPRDIAEFEARFGIPIIEGYGSTEGAIRLLPVRGARPGALGRSEPGVDVAVVDAATGKECPPAQLDGRGLLLNPRDAVGEIVRRDPGASGFEGYYKNPEATAARLRNGWFWSGDLAYRDDEGVFYFAGRTVDWLRVDGENFAAAPVERIIGRHPDVAAVAVYAVPDPRTGDRVMAALELRVGATFDPVGFASFLGDQADLGTKWWPRFVRVTSELPVTATAKVAKHTLRAEAWRTEDSVWWQPARGRPYVRFSADDAAELASQFESHGRSNLHPH